MLRELLARIAPHVPLALHQHYPERAPPTASELRQLEAISRLEAINLGGELARCAGAPGAAPLGGTAPWVRACSGAPEVTLTLTLTLTLTPTLTVTLTPTLTVTPTPTQP